MQAPSMASGSRSSSPMSDWVGVTLAQLTLDEKLLLLAGRDMWHTPSIGRAGVPALKVTDGPNGARGADGNHGPASTSFPVGAAMGATWSPPLIEEVGRALAHETRSKAAHVLLGPTVNIPRVPNAGRNFECFSEDPLLSGSIAAAWIRGVQSEGVSACIKHFVCNDQEHDRYNIDAVVDERSLREIYLEPFRIAVEQAFPWAVMSAYNTINGITASEHPMLDDVLRSEWGFDGLVMSDWFGTYGPAAARSGLDLEMPGPGRWLSPDVVRSAIEAGDLTEGEIDIKVGRLLTLIERTGAGSHQPAEETADERPEDRKLARRAASESMVLLTNDGLLPLDRPLRIVVIGELAKYTPNQGGGSSSVNPHRIVSVLEGIRAAAGANAAVEWMPGCPVRKGPPPIDPTSICEGGFLVEYFDHNEPTGDAVRSVRWTRSFLSFFGAGDRWVSYDDFAVRVSGRFRATDHGLHELSFGAAGHLRVAVDGDLVIDNWVDRMDGWVPMPIELEIGQEVDLVVEFRSATPAERFTWLGLGCTGPGPEMSIESAVAAAADADVAVIVAGLGPDWEGEGFDRPDLRLPGQQDELISAVAAAQPATAVVLAAGAAIEMPWADDVGAVLYAWYGGQEVGHAVADVLFGLEDPGGRLPVTVPVDSSQHPGLFGYPGVDGKVRYEDGVHVGYRGFDERRLEPRFAFGHGLSYTTFEVSHVEVRSGSEIVEVVVEIQNTGTRNGSEVIQVYAHDLGGVSRRLVGFQKVKLAERERRSVSIMLPVSNLRWWDEEAPGWVLPDGEIDLAIEGTFGVHRCVVPGGGGPVVD